MKLVALMAALALALVLVGLLRGIEMAMRRKQI